MNDSTAKSRIFVSYSHRGNGPRWKNALLSALHVFEKHHLLDVWQDGRIRTSSFWDDDIKEAMSSARLAVILLTDEALRSEYILREELPRLAERQRNEGLPVFAVICEACDWKVHNWLCATQTPNGGNPLSNLPQQRIDAVFRDLAAEIAESLGHKALLGVACGKAPVEVAHAYLDKFPLTRGSGLREEKLIGREQELALLDLAFAQPRTAIVSLVAWGGVGKTMLVQHWLKRLHREDWFGARRVYAWSFYSQGTKEDRQASEDTFLAHALEWFGVPCGPTVSPWDKGRLLADAITRERTLLILDGIEPLQYPPGPMGGQLRAPGVHSLLKQLARKAQDAENRGLCLVTTREPLTDLVDFERRPAAPWGGLLRVDLGNLTEDAGAALLHHAGAKRAGAAEIKADDAELLAADREVDGHALTLNLLGRFLARAHGGDVRRRDLVTFEEADRREQVATTFKMLAAFESWFAKSGEFGARQLAILRMLGLFDRPAEAGCLTALRKPPAIAGLTDPLFTTRLDPSTGGPIVQPLVEEDWNTATSLLSDFSLVVIQGNPGEHECWLDCHPLIREYFGSRLRDRSPEAWRQGHASLHDYLVPRASERPETAEEMQPALAAVYHGRQAGRLKESLELLGSQFESCRLYLGADGSLLSAISCFFEQPWDKVLTDLSEVQRMDVQSMATYCLEGLGRWQEGVGLAEASLDLCLRSQQWAAVISRINVLGDHKVALGRLQEALGDLDRTLHAIDRGEIDRRLIRPGLGVRLIGRRGNVLHQMGRLKEALDAFRNAEELQCPREDPFAQACPVLYSVGGFWFCDALLDEIEMAARKPGVDTNRLADCCEGVMDRARTSFAWTTDRVGGDGGGPRLRSVRVFGGTSIAGWLDHLTISRALFVQQRFTGEHDHREPLEIADLAINALRQLSRPFLAIALRLRARILAANDHWTRSKEDLDEAWDIAERGPMRLDLADIHLHRARLFSREKSYPWKSPQDDLAAAARLINDCGYHRRDEELADAKGVCPSS